MCSCALWLFMGTHLRAMFQLIKCHKGSQCYPTQVPNMPHLNSSKASWYSVYLSLGDRRLS